MMKEKRAVNPRDPNLAFWVPELGEKRFVGYDMAREFTPGMARPVTGDREPITREQREWLKDMAARRGGRGGVWMDAIEACVTVYDGLYIRGILRAIDPVKE